MKTRDETDPRPTEITDEIIEELRDEAGAAGDMLQVAYCDLALLGETTGLAAEAYARRHGLPVLRVGDAERMAARAECARVIAEAWAMDDGEGE